MQYPADVEAGRDIASRMKTKAVVLDGHYTTVEFMSLMGCMDAVIANRLHALIFSAIMQVPATAVSYDPKIDSFINLIGDKVCGTTEDVEAADIVADVTKNYLSAIWHRKSRPASITCGASPCAMPIWPCVSWKGARASASACNSIGGLYD